MVSEHSMHYSELGFSNSWTAFSLTVEHEAKPNLITEKGEESMDTFFFRTVEREAKPSFLLRRPSEEAFFKSRLPDRGIATKSTARKRSNQLTEVTIDHSSEKLVINRYFQVYGGLSQSLLTAASEDRG
eukprot:scaffold1177_cov79-Cylindrotheca_fusiformis.AAC.2